MTSKIYQLNEQKAVSETVDGESVVINLELGSYYSLNITGSIIWELAIARHSLEDIVKYVESRFEENKLLEEKNIITFVDSLVAEGLLVPTSEEAKESISSYTGAKEVFVQPAFVRYDDMQEMLLADPIHDVNDSGWPILKKNTI